jgi:four helix bundle protein
VSVEANIVEGYALDTEALFRKHLRIAFGSAAEAGRQGRRRAAEQPSGRPVRRL